MSQHHEEIADSFDAMLTDACSHILSELMMSDKDYRQQRELQTRLSGELHELLDGTGAMDLTPDDHERLKRYLQALSAASMIGMKHLYLTGMKDKYVMPKLLGFITAG